MKLKEITGSFVDTKFDLKPLKPYVSEGIFFDEGYIVSTWNKGLWIKSELNTTKIHPYCLDCEFDEIKDIVLNLDTIDNNIKI